MKELSKEEAQNRIAHRVAREYDDIGGNLILNTGVGIPVLVPGYIKSSNVFIQAENGILGIGEEVPPEEGHPDLGNAARRPAKELPGCCYFDSSDSFGMIRGGHIDVTILGAFEVDQEASMANYIIPNGKQLGVGGAMDLAAGAKELVVTMQHRNKDGGTRVLKKCLLPITAPQSVSKLFTEYAYFKFENKKMILKEIAPDITLDELKSITEAEFEIDPDLSTMPV